MSMKKIKFTGLLTRKKAVRYLIYILFVCVFAVFVIKLNQVEKTELVVRTGQRRHYLYLCDYLSAGSLSDWWETGN